MRVFLCTYGVLLGLALPLIWLLVGVLSWLWETPFWYVVLLQTGKWSVVLLGVAGILVLLDPARQKR